MNWIEAIMDSIDYMEDRLTEDIDIRKVAECASSSPYHYQRMFSLLTEMSVSEYIRNRRMSLAAADLLSTNTRVIDLAFKYGYESSEAFSRAFKSVHGASPRAVRKGDASIKAFLRLTIEMTLKGDVPMDYRIEKKGKFGFYGITKRFSTVGGENFKEIPRFWENSMKDGSFEALMKTVGDKSSLGVCMPMDLETNTEFDYLIAVFGEEAIEGYDYHEVPEAEWAVFNVTGPIFPNLKNTWKRIFSEWFPQTGFSHLDLPEFEVYLGGDPNTEDYQMEVWIPIKR